MLCYHGNTVKQNLLPRTLIEFNLSYCYGDEESDVTTILFLKERYKTNNMRPFSFISGTFFYV